MDPISQGVLGAVAAASLPRDKEKVRLAAFSGGVGGMLADADIFIRSETDSLLTIEYHRHFSHSLIFVPVGGLIGAAVLWALFRGKNSFSLLYLFATTGFATSGLLDACTSYGTQLLWPFSDARIAWNIISIIDPIFTGALLILMIIGVVKRRTRWMQIAVGFALLYLSFGVVQNTRVSKVQAELAETRGQGQAMEMETVKPSIGNLVLWRSVYRHGDRFYVDGIRLGLFGPPRIIEGKVVPALDLADLKSGIPADSVLAEDFDRFDHFSSGYLAMHPDEPLVISDLRYALLPDSVMPLWGIRYDPEKPDRHARFETFRNADAVNRERFFRMLFNGR
jgi:inner membrane protein